MIRIAVIQFPGSNCEAESVAAVRRAGMQPEEFLWCADPAALAEFDGYFLVGGFSYEDRSRAGVIASLDPVMRAIAAEAGKGKPVLGICNGAQILVESGLVPGIASGDPILALVPNRREREGRILGTGFYNAWTTLRATGPAGTHAFNRDIPEGRLLQVPLAHAEGRFVARADHLEALLSNGHAAFQYASASGEVDPSFPVNPNGSAANLAAVVNAAGNVMAMMPHPERTPGGDPIFHSMRGFIVAGCPLRANTTPDLRIDDTVEDFATDLAAGVCHLPIGLIITDNAAVSVREALHQLGFAVEVSRWTLWRTVASSPRETWEDRLLDSGEIANSNKEYLDPQAFEAGERDALFAVFPREDVFGPRTLAAAREGFGIDSLDGLTRGTLWRFRFPDAGSLQRDLPELLRTRIIHHPVSDRILRVR